MGAARRVTIDPVTSILVVRHGETEWNRERRIQGHLDPPLNETGREQARGLLEELRRELSGARPLLYTSDLLRARQTAHTLARGLGLRARRAAYLRERQLGRAQGRTWEELARELPAEVEAYRSHRDRDAIPGSEPLAAFKARVLRGARRIAERAASAATSALVVTHGGVVHALLELAHGPDRRFMIGNTARYWLDVDPASGLVRVTAERARAGETIDA